MSVYENLALQRNSVNASLLSFFFLPCTWVFLYNIKNIVVEHNGGRFLDSLLTSTTFPAIIISLDLITYYLITMFWKVAVWCFAWFSFCLISILASVHWIWSCFAWFPFWELVNIKPRNIASQYQSIKT